MYKRLNSSYLVELPSLSNNFLIRLGMETAKFLSLDRSTSLHTFLMALIILGLVLTSVS